MSFGKMNRDISITSKTSKKDSSGFSTPVETVLKTVRAYKEERHGTERWANMAAFSSATALFRFRKIPDFVVTTKNFITDGADKYRITSVEDVRGRGMYVEVLAEIITPSEN
jgi:SPP1 family predicted phage head-tail adaptor